VLKLFNSSGKKLEIFGPVHKRLVTIFTCGPSVYQRSHIGNFRTFLFEDVLVRYLRYSGYEVRRGMAVTDIEDKAIKEAEKRKTTVGDLTRENISLFIAEMKLLRIQIPDYLPRASECVGEAADIVGQLLDAKIAYRHKGNVYFDPLKFRGFGKLFGLDMSKWPKKKRRFHKDTYPGIQWNLGDFILWHGCTLGEGGVCWDTPAGRGRPAWNIQDPSMIARHFNETLSVYCGGVDNLYRHHDYSLAILESIRPYPMARFWLHGGHLYVDNQKMSKSKGNIYYTDTLARRGYTPQEIRFFLIYGPYRERLNYCAGTMHAAAEKLRDFRKRAREIAVRAGKSRSAECRASRRLRSAFESGMNNDLDVKGAFDSMHELLENIPAGELKPAAAAGVITALRKADTVLQVLFP
jgi:cysteinyl-tRNA synthetase